MPWGVTAAVVAAGGAVYSSKKQAEAAKKQTQAAEKGQESSEDFQLTMFREGQEATAPWREVGEQALGQLAGEYGLAGPEGFEGAPGAGFQETPGYQFQLAEAEKAAQRQLSAGGLSGSGAEMRELQRIAQGTAAQGYGDYLQGLRSMAGLGQTSAGQTATQATGVGANIGAGQYASSMQAGQAAAQGAIGQANVVTSAISQGIGAYGMYQGQQTTAPQAAPTAYGLPSGTTAYDPYGYRPEAGNIQYA